MGDNTPAPGLGFVEDASLIRPGDRVVSSGDGGLFPAGLLVGEVVLGSDERLRVRLAADYARLEFLRVLRSHRAEVIDDEGDLLIPPQRPIPALLPPALPPLDDAGLRAEGAGDD
jgi:rod shape-determining protein MreC